MISTASSLRTRIALSASKKAAAASSVRLLSSSLDVPRKSLVTGEQGVHETMKISKSWRNKALFKRQGDIRFKTGLEAANLLVQEAKRRDGHKVDFIDAIQSTFHCLAPIFERNPKYAFIAKMLMEPDRFVQFRVAWTDDTGVVRMNRGYRIQYSSSLGPYEGPLHLGSHLNNSVMKTLGFETLFCNAVTGYDVGAAVGGSDFSPADKSDGELQRFCQSFMTELTKYIGPDQDHPHMGMGVGPVEMVRGDVIVQPLSRPCLWFVSG
jgi:glutamate dehydrogenase (NADP+)